MINQNTHNGLTRGAGVKKGKKRGYKGSMITIQHILENALLYHNTIYNEYIYIYKENQIDIENLKLILKKIIKNIKIPKSSFKKLMLAEKRYFQRTNVGEET